MSNLDELIELKKKELLALTEAKKAEALAEQARKDEEAKNSVTWPIKYTYYVHASKGEATGDLFEEYPREVFSKETLDELHYLGYEETITILIHENGRIETIKFDGVELKND